MKILVIDNVNYEDYPTGGILNFYRNMLPAFGSDLLLAGITTDDRSPTGKWTKREICISIKRHINRILARNDFDILLTHKPEVVYFIPDAYMGKTCYILPGVGNPLAISRYPWARRFAKSYDRYFLMPKAAKTRWLLAAADYNARKGFAERSRGLIKAEHIIQFPTRYDDNYYYIDNTATREKKNIFVTVGRLGWFKGWKLMIDAFKIVNEKVPESELHFIGDGEDEKKIKEYIVSIGLENMVILDGKMSPEEIGKFLNKSSVFVMGSMMEGWSTTLVEACACGVPCVVTDFSSAREMVADGKNGFVVESRDESVFAEKMMSALALDRKEVSEYDKRFSYLAVSNLKEDLLKALKDN